MSAMNIVRDLGVSLPLMLVYVLGLGLALSQMSRLPRVALAAGGAFGVMLLMLLVRPVVSAVMIQSIQSMDGEVRNIHILMTLVGFVFTVIHSAAVGALIYAIFADRPQVGLGSPPHPWPPKPL